MKIFVVSADAVTDSCSGEMLDSGSVMAAFDTVEKANDYIDNVVETYTHKRYDYTITELDVG